MKALTDGKGEEEKDQIMGKKYENLFLVAERAPCF
jgi:hypothetical protein